MQARDAVFLEDLCPKLRVRRWRQSLHRFTDRCCVYCGNRSESIDHVHPQSRGGLSVTENCVPACLACNGLKGDTEAFSWYRRQSFYDPRRAMAIRAWTEGDLRLALRLLQWANPSPAAATASMATPSAAKPAAAKEARTAGATTRLAVAASAEEPEDHQTLQASTPLWRWQMAA